MHEHPSFSALVSLAPMTWVELDELADALERQAVDYARIIGMAQSDMVRDTVGQRLSITRSLLTHVLETRASVRQAPPTRNRAQAWRNPK